MNYILFSADNFVFYIHKIKFEAALIQGFYGVT